MYTAAGFGSWRVFASVKLINTLGEPEHPADIDCVASNRNIVIGKPIVNTVRSYISNWDGPNLYVADRNTYDQHGVVWSEDLVHRTTDGGVMAKFATIEGVDAQAGFWKGGDYNAIKIVNGKASLTSWWDAYAYDVSGTTTTIHNRYAE